MEDPLQTAMSTKNVTMCSILKGCSLPIVLWSIFRLQIAARSFCIPVSKIHLSETSTNTVPNTSASAASVSADLNGMAVKVRM